MSDLSGPVALGLTEYQAELAKWNRPYVYKPYPQVLYRCTRREEGGVQEETVTVGSDAELTRRLAEGYCVGPLAAKQALDALEEAVADAAAEAMGKAQKMGKKAREEFETRERKGDKHVTE